MENNKKLKGRLERLEGLRLVGWLLDTAHLDFTESFTLRINGEYRGHHTASAPRQVLIERFGGTGRHGISVQLGHSWLRPGSNIFEIYVGNALDAPFLSLEVELSDAELKRTAPRESTQRGNVRLMSSDSDSEAIEEDSKEYQSLLRPMGVGGEIGRRGWRGEWPPTPWSGEDVQEMLGHFIQQGQMDVQPHLSFITAAFNKNRFELVSAIHAVIRSAGIVDVRIDIVALRAFLRLGRLNEAVVLGHEILLRDPRRHIVNHYVGVANYRRNRFVEALRNFRAAIAEKADDHRYHLEAGRTCRAIAFGSYGTYQERPKFLAHSIRYLRTALTLRPEDTSALRELSQLYMAEGNVSTALDLVSQAAAMQPNHLANWLGLFQLAVRTSKMDVAADALAKAKELDASADTTMFADRLFERLVGSEHGLPSSPTTLTILEDQQVNAGDLVVAIEAVDTEWIVFKQKADTDYLRLIDDRGFGWVAAIKSSAEDEPIAWVWRRSFIRDIASLCLSQDPTTSTHEVIGYAALHSATVDATPSKPKTSRPARRVMLISQYGVRRFGGAEQFLWQMSSLYRELDYDVIVVGTRAELVGTSGVEGGVRYEFIENSRQSIFNFIVEEAVDIVHVVSGLGLEIAAAARFTNARVIFGVHFWRELFWPPTPSQGYYPNVSASAPARPEFRMLLEETATVYVNSAFSRDAVESAFSVRCPIIYSLPNDVNPSEVDVDPSRRGGVLLVNARSDKGFDMLLDVAARLHGVQFVAIASQSDIASAQSQVLSRGLTNVSLLDRVDDMAPLYLSARAVIVPSFRFVKTFSRVVIEAQRYGTPVIGAESGNIPYLLAESGVSLPDDADSWADEVTKLVGDDAYWSRRSELAIENSNRYRFSDQGNTLKLAISNLDRPFLLGVGSGLGNIIHATPLIRRLSIALGRRIDVVVAGDYADVLGVVSNPEYVNSAFLLGSVVLNKRYETVYLTNCFGPIEPKFSANQVIRSRDWDTFRPDHLLHEAHFNLEAAKVQLGIEYEQNDVKAAFFGGLTRTNSEKGLIGFHGGSKGGVWAAKRWPHFEELANRLRKRGYTVASFGTANEYVEGTEDRTGGSIEQMAEKIALCEFFVSNDSGVMNVANALSVPLVAIFAPTNADTRGPLGNSSRSVSLSKPCSPCEIDPIGSSARFRGQLCDCIQEIGIDEVLAALEELGLGWLRKT